MLLQLHSCRLVLPLYLLTHVSSTVSALCVSALPTFDHSIESTNKQSLLWPNSTRNTRVCLWTGGGLV